VRAQTIRDFESRFGLQGVMTAGYGLAEATVGVSMSKPGKNPTVDARGFVSVGCPFPEVEIRILEDDLALPAGEIGEVAIRTLARCTGYYNAPEETRQLFTGDGFLLSGDLGFVDEAGQLYIVGRRKNSIKHAGETIAPRELEEIVDAAPGVRFSAAVGIDRGRLEGEQVYVFAEVQPGLEPARCEQTVMDVVESLHGRLGFRPARVLLLKPRAIPRTHNGKIQHLLLREQYLSGQLRRQGLVVFPEA
jgi:acyl-CoA synthetase (AMP-forming)/AMP-acid ligase II